MAWTGIGSRKTPLEICRVMTRFARTMKSKGRSGAAERADEKFELGMRNPEIFLPWKGFMKHKTGFYQYTPAQWEFAYRISQEVYPVLIRKRSHKALFGRNVFQVTGLCDCEEDADPSKFVVCWTPDGCIDKATYNYGETGGTGVAIMIAEKFGVPVYNWRIPEHLQMALDRLDAYDYLPRQLVRDLKAEGHL